MSTDGHSLLALFHRVQQISAERFLNCNDENLTIRQAQILAAIDQHDGASQQAIVQTTAVDRSTLADITRRLVARGLVRRRRNHKDHRAYVLHLTENGRKVLRQTSPVLDRIEQDLLAVIPVSKRAEFKTLLGEIAVSALHSSPMQVEASEREWLMRGHRA